MRYTGAQLRAMDAPKKPNEAAMKRAIGTTRDLKRLLAESPLERELLWQIQCAGLPEPEREYRFAPPRRFRFDFAWPDKMLAVEAEGGTWMRGRSWHLTGAGYEKDLTKANLAIEKGWRVLRFTSKQIKSGEAIRTLIRVMEGKR